MNLLHEVSPLRHLTQQKSFADNAARRVERLRNICFVRRSDILPDTTSMAANFEPTRFAEHVHGACRRRHCRQRVCPARCWHQLIAVDQLADGVSVQGMRHMRADLEQHRRRRRAEEESTDCRVCGGRLLRGWCGRWPLSRTERAQIGRSCFRGT